jgi:transposase
VSGSRLLRKFDKHQDFSYMTPDTLYRLAPPLISLQLLAFFWAVNREIGFVDAGRQSVIPLSDVINQLDLQAIHRVRDRLISRRTAVINQLRAFLLERGMVFAKTPAKLRAAMADVLENADADLTPQMRNLISMLWDEWKLVEQQIAALTDDLERIADSDAGCVRIRKIPGIGPIVATAIVAAIGNGAAFRKGRDFAAWLGVVPRQYSTGGKAKLLGISKRGNVYLRKVLIHGARAAAMRIKRDRVPIGAWMNALEARAPRNVLVVAMANKLARIAWAVLSSGNEYRPVASTPA